MNARGRLVVPGSEVGSGPDRTVDVRDADAVFGDDAVVDEDDGRHDFDFYFGRWRVQNRRLRARLEGCTDWEEFEATQECRPVLAGIGNIDDFVTDWGALRGTPFRGMTLRLFDVARREWSLYWASNRSGRLEAPVVGRFRDGVGRFIGSDEHAGRPVLARFEWSAISADAARWEQALSADAGATWETNWTMQMTRIEAGVSFR